MPTKFKSPSKFKSPYATAFTTAVKKGTPCNTVVWNISNKTKTPPSKIWNSLYKAGVCQRAKFNGTWVYWPCFPVKKNVTAKNTTQTNMWQWFVDWCVFNGWCKPAQWSKNAKTQKAFMTFCRKYFAKQFGPVSKPAPKRKPRKTRKSTRKYASWTKKWSPKHTKKRTTPKRTYTTASNPWGRNYNRTFKFPTVKSRPATRRYARAA